MAIELDEEADRLEDEAAAKPTTPSANIATGRLVPPLHSQLAPPQFDLATFPPALGDLDCGFIVLGLELVGLLDMADTVEEIESILDSSLERDLGRSKLRIELHLGRALF
jgi:hypothetical protein